MKGHSKHPEATAAAIRDGWFHSGDIGTFDADGDWYIVDRLQDVYPREVEEVLYTHPAVADAAVIGVPHPTRGEDIKALVRPRPDAVATEQDLISYCRERLAVYKYPRSVEFRAELPRGPTGELLKKALRSAT